MNFGLGYNKVSEKVPKWVAAPFRGCPITPEIVRFVILRERSDRRISNKTKLMRFFATLRMTLSDSL